MLVKYTKLYKVYTNKSFQQGVFPEQMKMAKVVPIHKDGPKTEIGNYRPILLLTIRISLKYMNNSCTMEY